LAWDVILLLCGGLALGNAVQNTGLLAYITKEISKQLIGLPVILVLAVKQFHSMLVLTHPFNS
jgi:di/tricarboxylate transporter